MQKKLTLRMEKDLIDYAKEQARERGTSVSKMVADYFAGMARLEKAQKEGGEAFDPSDLPPITRSLVGSLKGSDLTEEDYYRYLEEKYK